jgi:hypothetical protein
MGRKWKKRVAFFSVGDAKMQKKVLGKVTKQFIWGMFSLKRGAWGCEN